MKTIFVDGYNVINSWPTLKVIKNVAFDGARQSLIDTLHNYAVFEACKIFVIFDAYKVSGSIEKIEEISEDITVIFTKDGETADSYIEKKVSKLGRKHEIVVVTSDNLEQQTIFQRGATRMNSLEFYNEVSKAQKVMQKGSKYGNCRQKNNLGDNLSQNVLEKLEQIRNGN